MTPLRHWLLVLCTFRYALGRRSYIVSEVCETIRDEWANLRSDQCAQLQHELRKELERYEVTGGLLGDECDDREWRRLLAWMVAQ